MEVLFRVVDKVNQSNPVFDAKCRKRGDIVVIKPDGWAWSEKEKTNPEWRIIRFPDSILEDVRSLQVPELDKDPQKPKTKLKRHAFKFDFDGLTGDAAAKAEDALRTEPIIDIPIDVVEFRKLKIKKPDAKE